MKIDPEAQGLHDSYTYGLGKSNPFLLSNYKVVADQPGLYGNLGSKHRDIDAEKFEGQNST